MRVNLIVFFAPDDDNSDKSTKSSQIFAQCSLNSKTMIVHYFGAVCLLFFVRTGIWFNWCVFRFFAQILVSEWLNGTKLWIENATMRHACTAILNWTKRKQKQKQKQKAHKRELLNLHRPRWGVEGDHPIDRTDYVRVHALNRRNPATRQSMQFVRWVGHSISRIASTKRRKKRKRDTENPLTPLCALILLLFCFCWFDKS